MFGLLNWLQERLDGSNHPGRFSDLNLPLDDSGYFITDKGEMVSVIEIMGSRRYVDMDRHYSNVGKLDAVLEPYFRNGDADVWVLFRQDSNQENNARLLRDIFSPVSNTIRSLGFNADSLLEEDVEILSESIHSERCWLVIYSTGKNADSSLGNDIVPPNLKPQTRGDNSNQNISLFSNYVVHGGAHVARVQRILGALDDSESLDIRCRLLSCTELGFTQRFEIAPTMTGSDWRPRMVMDGKNQSQIRTETKVTTLRKATIASFTPHKFGYQVWPVEPEPVDGRSDTLQIGSRIFKMVVVKTFPNGPRPFAKVQQDLHRAQVPFRFSAALHSKSFAALKLKYALASVLSIIPLTTQNRRLHHAISNLEKVAASSNEVTGCAAQYVFVTWADNNDFERLEKNSERLIQAINGWAHADGLVVKDNLLETLVSSVPAYRNGSTAPVAVGPLKELLAQMPIGRPAFPYSHGAMCFRSEDGKAIPFQPFDYNVIQHHVYLILGEPGYGKSAMVNNMLKAFLLSSNDIPHIGINDIGQSSVGFIRIAQSILPEDKRHFAICHKMRNTRENGYNILNTDYGLEYPLDEHKTFISNTLELLMMNLSDGSINSDITGLIGAVLNAAYRRYANSGPQSQPKMYNPSSARNDPFWFEVEKALIEIGIEPTEEHTYWDIFNALHRHKKYRAASLVQRFAVPTLSDLTRIATLPEIKEEYPGEYDTGTSLIQYFNRRIGEILDRYPVLAGVTMLDLGEAKIIAIDNDEVVVRASKGEYSKQQQGALFTALSARILTSRFFWKEDRLSNIPEHLHDYYEQMIRDVRRTTNVYFEDEVQRTAHIPQSHALREEITNEGRKWQIGIVLASQDITEMPERVIKFSTLQIICGLSETAVDETVEKLKLSPSEKQIITAKLKKPSAREGAWVYMIVKADKGTYRQLLNSVMGPQTLWGLSTTNRDAMLRDEIYRIFPPEDTRRLLAKLFPSGSINSEYEKRLNLKQSSEDTGLFNREDYVHNTNIMDDIKEEIIEAGRRFLYGNDSEAVTPLEEVFYD